jgi:hypothetical protein
VHKLRGRQVFDQQRRFVLQLPCRHLLNCRLWHIALVYCLPSGNLVQYLGYRSRCRDMLGPMPCRVLLKSGCQFRILHPLPCRHLLVNGRKLVLIMRRRTVFDGRSDRMQ